MKISYAIAQGCVFAAVVAAVPASADTLTYGTYLSAHHATNRTGVEPFMRAVEEQTDGALKFTIMADGTIIGGRDALQGLRDGLVDMAMIVDLYTPNELKTSNILSDLALLGSNDAVMTGAANEMQVLNCPTCEEEAEANNLKVLAIYASTPYSFICNKKYETAEDFRGARVRATGGWASFAASLGATPVNITSGEMYEALQRGQVDCTLINIPALTNYSLFEVAKFVIDLPIGTFNGGHFLNMSTSAWDARSPEEQAIIMKNVPKAVTGLLEGAAAEENEAREVAKGAGVEFLQADPSLVDALEAYRKNELTRVAELARSRGLENPEPLMEKFIELIGKWEGIVEEADGDWSKYEAALQTEIYDKIK